MDTAWDRMEDLVLTERSMPEIIPLLRNLPTPSGSAAKRLSDLQQRIWLVPEPGQRAPSRGARDRSQSRLHVVAAALPLTPLQFLKHSDKRDLLPLLDDPATRDAMLELFARRGEQWLTEYCERSHSSAENAVRSSTLAYRFPVLFDLPLPTDPRYWRGWVADDPFPRPGVRWQEYFLAACAAPETFQGSFLTRDEHRRRVRIDELRAVEPIDDDALLDALVRAMARLERPANQRHLMMWLEDLGLLARLHEKADLLVNLIPLLDSTVVKELLAQLLPDATPARLAALAPEVLSRKEKLMRRQVLRALKRIDAPSPELMELVAAATADPDAEIVRLAAVLTEAWGGTATVGLGLWQEPSLPEVAGLDEVTALELPGLLGRAVEQGDLAVGVEELLWMEQVLAALVTHGHEHGRAATTVLVEDVLTANVNQSLPRTLLNIWVEAEHGNGRFPLPGWRDGLDRWAAARFRDALRAVGDIPCLLSTPTHTDGHLAWPVLVARLERYREAGVEPVASDLHVALGRVFDDDGSPVPVAEEAISAWRASPPGTPGLMVAEQSLLKRMLKGQRHGFKVVGDESPLLDVLDLGKPWTRSPWWRPGLTDFGWGVRLLPRHPGQAWGCLLRSRRQWSAASWLMAIGGSVPRLGALGSFAAMVATATGQRERDEDMATVLVTLWDEGRVTGGDLVQAWHSPWWQEGWWRDQRNPLPTARMLIRAAELGGLQLAWPLLTEVAEEIATMDPLPKEAHATLEAVFRYLPEVPRMPPLPAITALAERSSSSKAIRAAKQIAKLLPQQA